jgi:hypothetical protein
MLPTPAVGNRGGKMLLPLVGKILNTTLTTAYHARRHGWSRVSGSVVHVHHLQFQVYFRKQHEMPTVHGSFSRSYAHATKSIDQKMPIDKCAKIYKYMENK